MQFRVLEHTNLTPLDEEKDVYHLRLAYSEPFCYQPGDWVTVQPQNPPGLVNEVMVTLALEGDELIELKRAGRLSVREALENYIELTQLNPSILNKVQRQYGLGHWSTRQEMMDYAEGRDVLDLLTEFPGLCDNPYEALLLLSPLAPRYYSLASACEEVGDQEVHLLYKHVRFERAGRARVGAATTHLCDLNPGDTFEGRFVENKTFHLNQENLPAIMVGAGTGAAPYIGFLQRMEALWPDRLDQAWLFFGETFERTCFLFEKRLNAWQAQGLHLKTAFSRDGEQKWYVQDRLWEMRELVWEKLNEGGTFYLCGDKSKMAKDVEAVMLRIFKEVGAVAHPESLWKEWKKNRRIQVDVY